MIDKEFSELIPDLTPEEYAGLEQSILSEGCRDAIVMWQGVIIDGHNRYKICTEHNIPFKTIEKHFESRSEAINWIIDNQLSRRNLTPEQRTYLIGKKYREEKKEVGRPKGKKIPQNEGIFETATRIANQYKVGHATVERAYQFANAVDILDQNTGAKQKILSGELKIAQKDVKKLAELEAEEQKEVISLIVSGQAKSVNHAELIQKRKKYAEAGDKVEIRQDIDLRLGDFRNALADLPDNSIDLILTDPPYPAEFLPLWRDLSLFANRVLKPGKFLIAYSGQFYLPEVLRMLSEHLIYYWTFCLYHTGATKIINGVNIINRWKPVVIFQKAPRQKIIRTIQDYIENDKREKDKHNWQQGEMAVSKLIELFTDDNDVICDPFTGAGTVPKACKTLGRKFVGSEIDKQSYGIAKFNVGCPSDEKV